MPPTEAVTVDPHDTVVDLGQLSVAERTELEAELDPLAYTGFDAALVASAAAMAILVGAVFVAVTRPPRRRAHARRARQ